MCRLTVSKFQLPTVPLHYMTAEVSEQFHMAVFRGSDVI